MKKTLLILSALLMSLGTFAQDPDVVLDFTSNTWGLPEGKANLGTEAKDFTNGTYTITLTAASSGYYYNTQGYLMLGKTDATLALPKFESAVEKIEVVGRTDASASTKQNIYVGDEAVSTETTGAKTTNTYEIAADKQAAGTQYVLKVTSNHNTQITTINIYYASNLKPANLAFSAKTVDYEQGSDGWIAPTFSKETTAPVTFASSYSAVAGVDAEGNITLGSVLGTTTITATSEANDVYAAGKASVTITVWQWNKYAKSTSLENDAYYLIVAQRNDTTAYAGVLDESKTYGYVSATLLEGLQDTIAVKSSVDPAYQLEKVAGKDAYYIVDDNFRYIYNDGSHNTISAIDELPDASDVDYSWTITERTDGTMDLVSNDHSLMWGQGTYKNFGCYSELTDGDPAVYVYLYKEVGSETAISTVNAQPAATSNAIYNLAGQQVGKAYKGIVVKNGKKYIQK